MEKVHNIEEGIERNPILDRIWLGQNSAPNCTVYHSNKVCKSDIEYVRKGIEKEETIKEVCEWLDNNKEEYQYKAPYNYFDVEQCIEDLKKHFSDK